VDLEKTFDRVPREVVCWAVCKLDVDEQSCYLVFVCMWIQEPWLRQFVVITKCLKLGLSGFRLSHLLFAIINGSDF